MNSKVIQSATNIDLVRDEALEQNLKESRESLFKSSISMHAQEIINNRKSDIETKGLLETIKRKHEEEKRKKKSAEFSKTRYNIRTPQTILSLLDLQSNPESSSIDLLKTISQTFFEIKNSKTAFLLFNPTEGKFSDFYINFDAQEGEVGGPDLVFWEEYRRKNQEKWPNVKIPMWSQEKILYKNNQFLEFTWPYFYKTTFLGISIVIVPLRKGPPTNAEAREIEILLSCAQGVYLEASKSNLKPQQEEERTKAKPRRPSSGLYAIFLDFVQKIQQLGQENSFSETKQEEKETSEEKNEGQKEERKENLKDKA